MAVDGGAGATERTPDLELVRVAIRAEGCFGVILIDHLPAGLVTLERTYAVDPADPCGAQYVKIPSGRYRCVATRFERGGYDTFEVTGVIGHSRLLFHRLNFEGESEGCIGIGLRSGWIGAKPVILNSREGFAEFIRLTNGRRSFDLIVKDPA